jgi:acid phosphatase type 7
VRSWRHMTGADSISWLLCGCVLALTLAAAQPSPAITGQATAGVVIGAAGDIACDERPGAPSGAHAAQIGCHQAATAEVLKSLRPAAVLTLGDEQYEKASYDQFMSSYDRTWGAFKSVTHPAPGNHEYGTKLAAGYFAYFGAAAGDPAKGYYSFDMAGWHFIALNGNCGEIGGCQAGSPQERWLAGDLAAHPAACTLAYWHQPRFSSGIHHSDAHYADVWHDLYAAHADIVLNGHDHDYERFAPQTPAGAADPDGIREFVVGTGGKSHYGFTFVEPNSQVRNASTFGVLALTLYARAYDWRFVPEAGATFTDSGRDSCHGRS